MADVRELVILVTWMHGSARENSEVCDQQHQTMYYCFSFLQRFRQGDHTDVYPVTVCCTLSQHLVNLTYPQVTSTYQHLWRLRQLIKSFYLVITAFALTNNTHYTKIKYCKNMSIQYGIQPMSLKSFGDTRKAWCSLQKYKWLQQDILVYLADYIWYI